MLIGYRRNNEATDGSVSSHESGHHSYKSIFFYYSVTDTLIIALLNKTRKIV